MARRAFLAGTPGSSHWPGQAQKTGGFGVERSSRQVSTRTMRSVGDSRSRPPPEAVSPDLPQAHPRRLLRNVRHCPHGPAGLGKVGVQGLRLLYRPRQKSWQARTAMTDRQWKRGCRPGTPEATRRPARRSPGPARPPGPANMGRDDAGHGVLVGADQALIGVFVSAQDRATRPGSRTDHDRRRAPWSGPRSTGVRGMGVDPLLHRDRAVSTRSRTFSATTSRPSLKMRSCSGVSF